MAFSSDYKLKVDMGRDKAVLRKHEVYQKFRDVLERRKIGFSSDISLETKQHMVRLLTRSKILVWPIFQKKNLEHLLNDQQILSAKYERILFRLFQLHLWALEFSE